MNWVFLWISPPCTDPYVPPKAATYMGVAVAGSLALVMCTGATEESGQTMGKANREKKTMGRLFDSRCFFLFL